MASSQVLQLPIQRPVFYREYKSGLYSVSAYYFGILLVNSLAYLYFPILVGIPIFAFINPFDDSFGNFMNQIGVNILGYLNGLTLGYSVGA